MRGSPELNQYRGGPYLHEPIGSVAIGDLANFVEWSRHNAPPPTSAGGATWDRWYPTPVRAGERPYSMLRVGVIKGMDRNDPALAMVGGLGEGHLSFPSSSDIAVNITLTTLLRTVGLTMPGTVNYLVYNDGTIAEGNPLRSATIKDFSDLSSVQLANGRRLLEPVYSDQLENTLAKIWQFQERLTSGEIDWAGTLKHPWQVLVMLGDADLTERGRAYLNRLIRAGTNWGMFIGIGVRGLEPNDLLQDGPPQPARIPYRVPYVFDPPPPRDLIRRTVSHVVEAAKRGPVKIPPAHEYYEVGESASTAKGIEADIGIGLNGSRVKIRFDDSTPHGLLEGASGDGKTNTLRSLICSLARYSPDKLNLILVDGKYSGMAVFGSSPEVNDPAFLPQATRLGLNVTDPEDWLAILEELDQELDRRKTLMGDHRAADFGELQAIVERKGGTLPRTLLIWDEVQELFGSAAGSDAITILNRLATMGRELGIHLLLATVKMDKANNYDVQGTGLLDRFLLRLATSNATSVLDPVSHRNFMPLIPKYAIAVNTNGGKYPTGNQIARVPEANINSVRAVKAAAWKRWGSKVKPPVVLDGRAVPDVRDAPSYRDLQPSDDEWPVGFIGQKPGATGEAADFQFNRAPGRHVAVLGSDTREIAQVFGSLAATIPKQYRPGEAKFSIVCRNPELVNAARETEAQLKRTGHPVATYTDRTVGELLKEVAGSIDSGNGSSKQDHYLFIYGANGLVSDEFETILKEGSEQGVHVIGAWPNAAKLRQVTSYTGPTSVIEGYVLLNVTSDEVSLMSGEVNHPWGKTRRPGRALFGDARSGERPRVVKLYR